MLISTFYFRGCLLQLSRFIILDKIFAYHFTIMRAFSLSTMKKHPSLIPLVVIIGAGMTMCAAYVFRLATKSPEVSWNKRGNPEPWNDYEKKQYKFYAAGRDYSAIPDRPKF